MVKASREAGSFLGGGLGGFLSSPFGLGSLGVVALGITLFIFRDRISDFFQKGISDLGQGIGNINIDLPEINFPEINFPEITFPEIKFPDFGQIFGGNGDDKSILAGEQDVPIGGGFTADIPPDTTIDPDTGIVTSDTPPILNIPPDIEKELKETIQERNLRAREAASGVNQVQTELETDQQFFGFGQGFEGGVIRATPIENLSLSQIIDRFMVTASQAADIRAQAIGFTPEEESFLNQGQIDVGGFVGGGAPAVSDPMFEGLTPTEIVRRLTGGIITNF